MMRRMITLLVAVLMSLTMLVGPASAGDGNSYGADAGELCDWAPGGTPLWKLANFKNRGQCVKAVVHYLQDL